MRVLRGNPGKRRLNEHEPQPAPAGVDFDTPPDELVDDVRALVEWRRVAPMLRLCGLVSNAERSSLIALCQQWSRYLDATKRVSDLGMVVKRENGSPMANPYLVVADRALSHCHRLWVELAHASARSKLAAALPRDRPRSRK
jgi:P27 family predicted phage terminase small subunit